VVGEEGAMRLSPIVLCFAIGCSSPTSNTEPAANVDPRLKSGKKEPEALPPGVEKAVEVLLGDRPYPDEKAVQQAVRTLNRFEQPEALREETLEDMKTGARSKAVTHRYRKLGLDVDYHDGKVTGASRVGTEQPQSKLIEYRVTRHDFVGNLAVYLAGENDGFVVYMPAPKRLSGDRLAVTVDEGLRVQHTPYRFNWNGPFFSGSPKPSDELSPKSGTGVLERKDGKLLFSVVGLEFDGKSYSTIGPVEVKLGVPSRP